MLGLIALSCGALAADTPLLDPASPLKIWLDRLDLALTLAFTAELAVKVAALGARAYLRDAWNALDAFVVGLAFAELGAATAGYSLDGLAALKAVRALRALRPLRAVKRMPGLKIVVETLLQCVPDVASVSPST